MEPYTRPHLHFATKVAAIRRLYIGLRVRYKYQMPGHRVTNYKLSYIIIIIIIITERNIVVLVWPRAAHRPRADRGLRRPTSVFRTTIGVCRRCLKLVHKKCSV